MGNKNIILIGMPSSGKSTIGKHLSKVLARDFVDTDFLIKSRENRELRDIVNTEGLQRFLDIQEEVVTTIDLSNCIIATGGSVVYGKGSMEHLKNSGIVIYLKLEYIEIESRITAGRRFARTNGQSFFDLYTERTPLYERYADIVLDCSGKSVEKIAEEIMEITSEVNKTM
ncbi:MAG: shikimate kinase [Clostridia bacterium]|nr:shikimate kinase [Clostridia bacterium]